MLIQAFKRRNSITLRGITKCSRSKLKLKLKLKIEILSVQSIRKVRKTAHGYQEENFSIASAELRGLSARFLIHIRTEVAGSEDEYIEMPSKWEAERETKHGRDSAMSGISAGKGARTKRRGKTVPSCTSFCPKRSVTCSLQYKSWHSQGREVRQS